MNMRQPHLALFLALAMTPAVFGLAGCKTSGAAKGGAAAAAAQPSALAMAYDAWKAGNMEAAFEQGSAIANNMRHPAQTRQEAAYLAGKAARKLNRRAEAVTLLSQAAESSDKVLRGQALAECGMAQNEMEHFKAGADSLLKATDLLSGEERAMAYFHAGIAEQKLNYWSQARIHLIDAMRYTADAGLRADIDRQINVTGYTLQVGSFLDANNAQRVAAQWKDKAEALRLKPARVIKAVNAAKQEVFLVQVGQFSTFDSARARQGALGAAGGVVVPLWGN